MNSFILSDISYKNEQHMYMNSFLLHIQGGWGEQTVAQVKKMGSALARQTGGEEGEVIRHLVQRVSVLLTRGNAALLLNRMPSLTHPAVNGVA